MTNNKGRIYVVTFDAYMLQGYKFEPKFCASEYFKQSYVHEDWLNKCSRDLSAKKDQEIFLGKKILNMRRVS